MNHLESSWTIEPQSWNHPCLRPEVTLAVTTVANFSCYTASLVLPAGLVAIISHYNQWKVNLSNKGGCQSIAILARKIPHWRFLRMSMVALSAYAGGTIQAHGSTLFDVSTRVIAWEKWQQRVLGLAALSIRGSSWPEKMPKPDRWQLFVLLHAKPSWVQGGECAHVPHILCMCCSCNYSTLLTDGRTASGNVQWPQAAAQAWKMQASWTPKIQRMWFAQLDFTLPFWTGFEYHKTGRCELWSKPAGHSVVKCSFSRKPAARLGEVLFANKVS